MFWLFYSFMFCLFVIIYILYSKIKKNNNKKYYNNGISPFDGTKWEQFDVDSSGALGFKDISGNTIWIDKENI